LDVESRGVLLEALQDYEGTLCLVSHDRSFVSPLVDTVLEIIPHEDLSQGSQVVQLLGGYEEYLARKVKEAAQAASPSSSSSVSKKKAESFESSVRSGPSNNQKKAWEKERDQLESEISQLEKKQAEFHLSLANPKTYEDKTQSLRLMEEQRLLEKNLGEKLSRWEELCHLLS
jgi:ATP-binding cassette subfamily F protein 3